MTTSKRLSTVEKSFQIVQELDDLGTAGLTELADRLDLHKSTAFAHLQTLVSSGYVVKEDERYRLSFRFLEHGGSAREDLEIFQQAKTEIDALSEATGELANLSIIEDNLGVMLYRAEGEESVSNNGAVGSHDYLHNTAYGKAMMTHLPESEVDEIIEQHGLPRQTENTITDREGLFEEFERIREQGYAMDREENNAGLYCIGSAVTDGDGYPIAGVSLTGPANKLDDADYVPELAKQIQNTVNKIELQLMYGE